MPSSESNRAGESIYQPKHVLFGASDVATVTVWQILFKLSLNSASYFYYSDLIKIIVFFNVDSPVTQAHRAREIGNALELRGR